MSVLLERLSQAPSHLLRAWRVLRQAGHGFNADQCLLRAQALSFTTILALVPLTALSLSVVSIASDSVEAKLRAFLLEHLLPASGSAVADHIAAFSERASAVGLVGLAAFIATALGLFAMIENTFNTIWGVTRQRPFGARVLAFLSLITLGPLFLGASITLTARLEAAVNLPPLDPFVAYLVPLLFAWAAFTLLYVLVPNARVRPGPGLAAGLAAGSLWELAKHGFDTYASVAVAVNSIYGSLSILPVFLAWVFLSWAVVLFGAELSHALQRPADLSVPWRSRPVREGARQGR